MLIGSTNNVHIYNIRIWTSSEQLLLMFHEWTINIDYVMAKMRVWWRKKRMAAARSIPPLIPIW